MIIYKHYKLYKFLCNVADILGGIFMISGMFLMVVWSESNLVYFATKIIGGALVILAHFLLKEEEE